VAFISPTKVEDTIYSTNNDQPHGRVVPRRVEDTIDGLDSGRNNFIKKKNDLHGIKVSASSMLFGTDMMDDEDEGKANYISG